MVVVIFQIKNITIYKKRRCRPKVDSFIALLGTGKYTFVSGKVFTQ